jgi:hypothetical protein
MQNIPRVWTLLLMSAGVASVSAIFSGCFDGGSADEAGADTTDTTNDTEPCWPGFDESTCEAVGWRWYLDIGASRCGTPPCQPGDYSFCALPCVESSDCAGTTAPYCGRIGYWGGRDNYGCSDFKVCVPEPAGYTCFQGRMAGGTCESL